VKTAAHPLPPLSLILGGQRSGKSTHAEALIGAGAAVYVATAEILDGDMVERIDAHRRRRPPAWRLIEAPTDLVDALLAADSGGRPILLESLGMWIANLLDGGYDVEAEISALVDAVQTLTSPLVVVSEETGLGIVADNALARDFVDSVGLANQIISAIADRVVLVVAGQPLVVKG